MTDLGRDFQRHVSVEFRIPGSIHLPHAAFADLGGDAVGPEGGAGGQAHGRGQYSPGNGSRTPVGYMLATALMSSLLRIDAE